MGQQIELVAADGFHPGGYQADPDGRPKGAIVVIQEIFGVNSHIREVCDGFAADGYVAIAPALFDRVERGIELGYEQDDIARGIEIVSREMDHSAVMLDLQAAIDAARTHGKAGVVGYCFGGTMAWLCACRADGLACAVGYYGGQIAQNVQLEPRVPVMLHFGERDTAIPMDDVNRVKEAHPNVDVYIYDAEHGFNCDHRASYDEASAGIARERTMEFFSEHLQGT